MRELRIQTLLVDEALSPVPCAQVFKETYPRNRESRCYFLSQPNAPRESPFNTFTRYHIWTLGVDPWCNTGRLHSVSFSSAVLGLQMVASKLCPQAVPIPLYLKATPWVF